MVKRRNCRQIAATETKKIALITFGENTIKPYIPRICPYFLDFLAFERKAGKFRMHPAFLVAQKGKTTVEITTTHSNSIAIFVKSDNRSYDNIEFFRRNTIAGTWLINTILISFQARIARNPHKSHFSAAFENRNKYLFSSLPRSFKNHTCVDFMTESEITRNGVCAKKQW